MKGESFFDPRNHLINASFGSVPLVGQALGPNKKEEFD
jgi:hypothetical protein